MRLKFGRGLIDSVSSSEFVRLKLRLMVASVLLTSGLVLLLEALA